MAQGSYNLGGDEVKEESSWRYPLIIFLTTLVLSVIVLVLYVGPDVEEIRGNRSRPTINDELVNISVSDIRIAVPANYTRFPRDRVDGERDRLTLYASWPRMDGYVPARKNDFVENEQDSRRIDILVESNRTLFSESERLDQTIMPNTIDRDGVPFEHDLTRYTFRQGTEFAPHSGYSDKEMFIGTGTDGSQVVVFCYLDNGDEAVPIDCYRIYDLSETVWVRYDFKRPYLAEWQRIDEAVRGFVGEITDGN